MRDLNDLKAFKTLCKSEKKFTRDNLFFEFFSAFLESKIQKTAKKKIFFLSFYYKNCFPVCVFYYDCRIFLSYDFLLRSFYHPATKIDPNLKKNCCIFKPMVGTGYPCFIKSNKISEDSYIGLADFFCFFFRQRS